MRPNDGKCHMEGQSPDSTGNIVYNQWNVQVNRYLSLPQNQQFIMPYIHSCMCTYFLYTIIYVYNIYTSYIQDYPSIGQIAEKLFEFDVIPIFAVVDNIQNIYSVCISHWCRIHA